SIADRASRYPVSGTTGRRLRAEARNFSNAQDPGEAGIQSPLGPAKRSCKASYDEGTGGGAATSNRSPLDPSPAPTTFRRAIHNERPGPKNRRDILVRSSSATVRECTSRLPRGSRHASG